MAQGTDSWNGRDAMNKRRQDDLNRWSTMLDMINKTTPQTMLGYGLGRLIKGYWDRGRDKKARNALNPTGEADSLNNLTYADLANATPGEVISPIPGLMGKGFSLGQTTQEVQNANGEKAKETTTTAYPFNANDYDIAGQLQPQPRLSLNEMAAKQLMGNNEDYFGLTNRRYFPY
jgi:hypothetical protein